MQEKFVCSILRVLTELEVSIAKYSNEFFSTEDSFRQVTDI